MEMKIAPLEVQKIQEAKLIGIKSAQREAFPADICNLTAGNPIGMKSRLKTLTPFLNESDILRAAGRIDRPAVSNDVKHPMISYCSKSSAVSSCDHGLQQEAEL